MQTEAYGILVKYYSGNNSQTESEYVLQKLGEKEGVTVNTGTGKVTYNGKTYDISEIIGETNEQKGLVANGVEEVADSPLLENENVKAVVAETANPESQAVIPAGFYYVTGKPSTGLVISDKAGDDDNNSKGGNQFVWVPCGENGANYKKHTYETTSVTDTSSTADTGNDNWRTYYYRMYSDWEDNGGDSSSVAKYGGFYVARYEAGVPEDANFYASKAGDTYYTSGTTPSKNVTTYIPVSKKNNQSWSYISQANAKIVSSNMYAGNSNVTSSLIDSYAWDTITQWMEDEISGIANNSTNYGNYYNSPNTMQVSNTLYATHIYAAVTETGTSNGKGSKWIVSKAYKKGSLTLGYENLSGATANTDKRANYPFADFYNFTEWDDTNWTYTVRKEIATGSLSNSKVKNIYDMAGNMYEWTTETGYHGAASGTLYAVLRGGGFVGTGSSDPLSCRRGHYSATDTNVDFGFRVVLYIK